MQLLKYGRSAEEHGHDAPRCHLALELFLYRFVLGFILWELLSRILRRVLSETCQAGNVQTKKRRGEIPAAKA